MLDISRDWASWYATQAKWQCGQFFRKEDKQAAADFMQAMDKLLLTDEAKRIPANLDTKDFQQLSELLSWWFAGVTVLADWLGSNTLFFPYKNQSADLEKYWGYAQAQATVALVQSGVSPSAIEKGRSLKELFPKIQQASPLQQWAVSVNIPQSSQIYLLEDVTGSGKTEAAMMLAYRLMEQGLAEGFFIGLPTMATANAMFKRVAEVYQKLFGAMPIWCWHTAIKNSWKNLQQLFCLLSHPSMMAHN